VTEVSRQPRDWDAVTYDRVSDPHVRWGLVVLERLALRGDEWVLDAGCGSGRVTEQLLDRLPLGGAIGLDASPSMLMKASRRLERFGDRVTLVHADLNEPLPIARSVDAVFSTATFHWISDHGRLFRHLAAVLEPGGQLVAQCGGAGCIATVVEALRAAGDRWDGPWNFATAEDTRRRLEEAGFVEVQTWLHDEPTAIEAGEPLETFLETVVLGAHLDRLPQNERTGFVKAVAARLPNPQRPVIDYVRLNIVARRGTADLDAARLGDL
jgi:trans-aconitate 2-methyltransferase